MKNRTLALWIAVGAFSIQHSAFSVAAAAAEPPARTPKALVIMLDGLRADAVENVAGAANLRMLRDGAWRPEYGCAWSLTANTILDAATPFCVGSAGADDAASRFAGDIDDFALWTRTLSHEDVRRIYEAGLKGAPLADLL